MELPISRIGAFFAWILLIIGIFVPRTLDILAVINPDGCYAWMGRSATFYAELSSFNFAGTYQSAHPGVLVMILSGAGLILGSLLTFGTLAPWEHMNDLALYSHLPVTLFTGMVLLLCYPLSREWTGSRLLSFGIVFLLAVDPVILTHSRYLHLDATASLLTLASIFSALSFGRGKARIYLLASAIALALAFLTRASSLMAAPIVALIIANTYLDGRRIQWFPLLRSTLTCIAVFLLTCFLLWPALWVDPIGSIVRLFEIAATAVNEPHEDLPQASANSAFLLHDLWSRKSLVSWLFFATGILSLACRLIRTRSLQLPEKGVWWVAAYGLLVILLISASEKAQTIQNGYRYGLSAFVCLQCISAYGLYTVVTSGVVREGPWRRYVPVFITICITFLLAYDTSRVFSKHPYYAAATNEISSPKHLGWGEGLDLVGQYLSHLEASREITVASFYPCVLRHHFDGNVISMREFISKPTPNVDYVVLYESRGQERGFKELFNQMRTEPQIHPEFVARIDGREYASVYRLSRQ